MDTIAKNIRAKRMEKGMTQEDLASKIFTTRQTVSNYETGKSKPDYETIGKIAEVLGVKAEEIFYDMSDRKKRIKVWTVLLIAVIVFLLLRSVLISNYPYLAFPNEDGQFMQAVATVFRSTYRTILIPSFSVVLGWAVLRLYEIYVLKTELRIKHIKMIMIVLAILLAIWYVGAFVDLKVLFEAHMDTERNQYGGPLMLTAYVESFYYRFIKTGLETIPALNAVFSFIGGAGAVCLNGEKEE